MNQYSGNNMWNLMGYSKLIVIVLCVLTGFNAISSEYNKVKEVEVKKENLKEEYAFFAMHRICLDSVQNLDLFLKIKPWMGTHYKWGGKTKKGVDCSGFVRAIVDSVFNIKFSGGSAMMSKEVEQIEKSDLQEGDLLFFAAGKRKIGHVAIYLGKGKFAHSECRYGVTISNLNDRYWSTIFVMAGRHTKQIQKANALEPCSGLCS